MSRMAEYDVVGILAIFADFPHICPSWSKSLKIYSIGDNIKNDLISISCKTPEMV